MTRTAVVLWLMTPMASSSAMKPASTSSRGVAGDGDHVQAHGADGRHRLQLLEGQRTLPRRGDHARVLAHGDEGAREAPHGGGGHGAALLHGVGEQGQGRGRAAGARALQAHGLQDFAHASRPAPAWAPARGPRCRRARRAARPPAAR